MSVTYPHKRLILRAVLRQVSPMVIRLVSVSDHMQLAKFHDIFWAILGWHGDLGYIIRVHAEEFNSFRRKTRSKALHELKLHRQEKFLYVCDTLHMWEWDVRVIDIQDAAEEEDDFPICTGGRRAAPPEHCGGPTGYRLMLKREKEGAAMNDPVMMEAGIQMFAEACPDEPQKTWDLLRTALDEGFRNIDRRLKESGPLQPERFNLQEANARLSELRMPYRRVWSWKVSGLAAQRCMFLGNRTRLDGALLSKCGNWLGALALG